MLAAERDVVLEERDSGTADDEVLRDVADDARLEESLLDRLVTKNVEVDRELTAKSDREEHCEHLAEAPVAVAAEDPAGLRALPGGGHAMGAPAAVPDLRAGRLLRLLTPEARDRALPRDRAPRHPQLRVG